MILIFGFGLSLLLLMKDLRRLIVSLLDELLMCGRGLGLNLLLAFCMDSLLFLNFMLSRPLIRLKVIRVLFMPSWLNLLVSLLLLGSWVLRLLDEDFRGGFC